MNDDKKKHMKEQLDKAMGIRDLKEREKELLQLGITSLSHARRLQLQLKDK